MSTYRASSIAYICTEHKKGRHRCQRRTSATWSRIARQTIPFVLPSERWEFSAYHSLHSDLWPLPGVIPTLVPCEWILVVRYGVTLRLGVALGLGVALRLGGACVAECSGPPGREWSAAPTYEYPVSERQHFAMADWRESTAQTRGDQGAGT